MRETKARLTKIEEKNRRVYFVIYASIILLMLFVNVYINRLNFLDSSNTVSIQPSDFVESFTVQELKEGESPHFNYEIDLPESSFGEMKGDEFRLIINGIRDNSVRVWFNDHLVLSEGDLEEGKSVLRSSHVYGSIKSENIQVNNKLRIESFADTRTGVDHPVLISEKRTGDRAIRLLDLYNLHFVYLGMGLMLMSVLFLSFLYQLDRERDLLIVYLGIATFLIGIYFMDFLPNLYLMRDYLSYKKFLLLSLSLGLYFYGRALYYLVQKKYVLIVPKLQLIYYLIIMLLSKNIIEFKSYYQYFYGSFIFMGIIYFLTSLINQKRDKRLVVLTLHFLTMILLGVFVIIIGKPNYFSPDLQLFIMLTVAFLPLLLAIDFSLDKHLNIQFEKALKNIAYDQSMTDDLTGVWNKRYLEKRLPELSMDSVVAIIDLDNLKMINDNYGHLAGDETLITLTRKMQEKLRREDEICRYGGDEFVILFDAIEMKDAIEILEEIRLGIAKKNIIHKNIEIKTTISIGLARVTEKNSGDKIIELADERLYQAKENGKNQVSYPKLINE